MFLRVYNANCIDIMDELIKQGETVDLTITSPPYDNLRSYNGIGDEWNFDIFKDVADRLYKITREGCMVVWICGDQVVKGSETGTSFRQALYFKETGFNLLDTMIWEKDTSAFPSKQNSRRYSQIFEYMFVFCKGKPRTDYQLLCDKPNKWFGHTNFGQKTHYTRKGELIKSKTKFINPVPEFSIRNNVWKQNNAAKDGDKEFRHDAAFPLQLIIDHIKSWSVEGDTVFDPFSGGGTTGVACIKTGRNFIGAEIVPEYYNNLMLPRLRKHKTDEYAIEEHGKTEVKHDIYLTSDMIDDIKEKAGKIH